MKWHVFGFLKGKKNETLKATLSLFEQQQPPSPLTLSVSLKE
ncbi:hypothetical protein Ahy_B01g056593 isoform B [Arachis hypogaea]|uniref:Uncharacterized protein n=1 Tax=Arachis hypogaea TaxID=3818 RepID=A0A445AZ51_ARAHY|nr:hypothetical protein Ahy_B01g056593 isoform B [Arachis hypogaea]